MNLEEAFRALGAAGGDLSLKEVQREQICRYIIDLLDYNLKVNLTAEADPGAILLRHVADGLAAVPVLKGLLPSPSPRILDLGAGAGFIGISLKIAWPEAQVTLMEAAKRKYDFLNLAASRLGLAGLRVVRKSAGKERPSVHEAGFDAVVERALAPLPEAMRLGLPLAAAGGFFMAYQSKPPDPRDKALEKILAPWSARWLKSVPYRLPLEDRERYLSVFCRG